MFMSRATVVHICCFLQELHFFFFIEFVICTERPALKEAVPVNCGCAFHIFYHLQTKHLSSKGNGTVSQVQYLSWKLQGEIATDFSDSLWL